MIIETLTNHVREYAWLITATLIAYLTIRAFKWLTFVRAVSKLPQPSGHFLLGQLPDVYRYIKQGCNAGQALVNVIDDIAKRSPFDKTPFVAWLGHQPVMLFLTPDGVEKILSSNKLIEKSVFYQFVHSWLGLGLLTSGGDQWRSRRKMLTPSFHFKILEDFLPTMTNETKIFVNVLNQHLNSNKEGIVEDISQPILMCALDVICETAMGCKVNAQSNPTNSYVDAIHKAGIGVMERMLKPQYANHTVFSLFPDGRQYNKCIDVIHDFTKKAIKGKKQEMMTHIANGNFEEKKCMTFMDTLIYKHLQDPRSISEQDIREEIDTFMFEGHDTTGWGMTWAAYLVGCNPTVQEKVHQELDSVFGPPTKTSVDDFINNANYTMEDLRQLKYLECVIKEAQRLCPSVPLFGRVVDQEDTVIDGHQVPVGTTLAILPLITHKDPNHWQEPEKFDPDRFLPENSVNRHPFAYVPFSAGPRNCIGQKFALVEEKAVLASLFRHFKLTSMIPFEQIKLMPAMILKSEQPLSVKLERRS